MARKWWALLTVCLGMLMLLVDITIVNVALPSIAADLNASFSDLQWTIDAYALSLAALMLVAGSLGDLLGHKRIFGIGLTAFTVSSLLCGLAPDALFLILCRAAQGVGGAAMFAASLALLASEFKGRERGTALGIWGATAGASVAVGPLIGGALTSGISWRWVFFVNVPIGAVTLAFLAVKVGETRRRPARPDWPGATAFACSLFALVFALIRGNPDGWTSAKVVSSFVVGGCLLVAFVVIELVRREPMLDLGLFRSPTFSGASLAAVGLSASLYSVLLYITLYLQDILGYSAFQAGLRFLPLTLLVLVAAPIGGRLSAHVPLRLLLSVGLTLAGIGLALMTSVEASSGWTVLLVGFVVAGTGSGLTNPPRASAAIGSVPEEKTGVGSGVNNTALQVGLAAGIAGLGAVFQSRVHDVLDTQLAVTVPQLGERTHGVVDQATSGNAPAALQSLPPGLREPVAHALRVAFVSGFDRILWIAAVISFVGAAVSLLLVRQRDLEPRRSSETRRSRRREHSTAVRSLDQVARRQLETEKGVNVGVLEVPGARLYYESVGSGPPLVLVPGGNGTAQIFGAIAQHLAEHYTVVTYDRRGFGRSQLDGAQDYGRRLQTDADDVRQVIERAAAAPASVFGPSSGAIVVLQALTRHPGVLDKVIAYEPPAMKQLPDGQKWLDFFDEVYEIYTKSGIEPALNAFNRKTFAVEDQVFFARLRDVSDASIRDDVVYWFEHELRQYTGVDLDLDALRAQSDRITVAAGRASRGYPLHGVCTELATKLGQNLTELPGGHTGYVTHDAEFATALAHVLDEMEAAAAA